MISGADHGVETIKEFAVKSRLSIRFQATKRELKLNFSGATN